MKQDLNNLTQGILFTDMYQLTMAQLYFKAGLHEQRAHFDHFFRHYPDYGSHQAGYCISAGLEWLLDWMEEAHFDDETLHYLAQEKDPKGNKVFQDDFLDYLRREGNFKKITVKAVAEGRVVHPQVPLTMVEGPLAMAQILETPLLNIINFQTLIATKSSRIRHSCGSRLLMEFGLRRAHGMGGNQGARAALIGGCDYTSNVGLSYALGLPPKGTHSHAMVQTWMAMGKTELEAFQAYAELYPDNCLLLVDTIDSLNSGVPNAIKVFKDLQAKGYRPIGVRIDSGDLAYLSVQVAKMLDEAGFPNTCIVLSNDLDEITIAQIDEQIRDEATRFNMDPEKIIKRLTYGVGTRLITSDGQSALGGVYKLVALERDGKWVPAMKFSNSISKMINPAHKTAWRIYDERGLATADLIGLADEHPEENEELVLHHPIEKDVYRVLPKAKISRIENILETVWQDGRRTRPAPSLEEMRANRQRDLASLDPGVLRMRNPHIYHVSLTDKLLKTKLDLIDKFRKGLNS
ncbi:nicotinate phosphoribosyltransferase [bacterium]|nr:nicotinate phosphoribosyltransferase [bacterium]